MPVPPTGYERIRRQKPLRKKPQPSGGRDTRPTEMMPVKKTPKKSASGYGPVPMPRTKTRSGYGPVPMPRNKTRNGYGPVPMPRMKPKKKP